MDDIKSDKDKSLCIFSIFLIVVGYAAERLIQIFATPTKTLALALAMVMTVFLAITYFILSKAKNSFYGLLAALIGYKMMPPPISILLNKSINGDMIYYIVSKVAIVLFIMLIIRFYTLQEKTQKIKPLPILAIMVSVPFFMQIAEHSQDFFVAKTGSMLYYYFTSFACYISALIVVLIISYKSNYETMKFAAYFEFAALSINALKRIGAIIANLINSTHLSRSYYVWIVIYIVLIACFYVAMQYKKKNES